MRIQPHIQAYIEHLLYAQVCANHNEDDTAVYKTWSISSCSMLSEKGYDLDKFINLELGDNLNISQ